MPAHARYDTLGKTYRYAILTGEARPVIKRRTAFVPGELIDAMRAASENLLERTISSFMDQGSPTKRLVSSFMTFKSMGVKLAITMTDGFLHMARIGDARVRRSA